MVESAFMKLRDFEDKVEELKKKKSWIKDEQRQEVIDRVNEVKSWINEQYEA